MVPKEGSGYHFEPCRHCDGGLIPDGDHWRKCDRCDWGLVLKFDTIPAKLVQAIYDLSSGYWTTNKTGVKDK